MRWRRWVRRMRVYGNGPTVGAFAVLIASVVLLTMKVVELQSTLDEVAPRRRQAQESSECLSSDEVAFQAMRIANARPNQLRLLCQRPFVYKVTI